MRLCLPIFIIRHWEREREIKFIGHWQLANHIVFNNLCEDKRCDIKKNSEDDKYLLSMFKKKIYSNLRHETEPLNRNCTDTSNGTCITVTVAARNLKMFQDLVPSFCSNKISRDNFPLKKFSVVIEVQCMCNFIKSSDYLIIITGSPELVSSTLKVFFRFFIGPKSLFMFEIISFCNKHLFYYTDGHKMKS